MVRTSYSQDSTTNVPDRAGEDSSRTGRRSYLKLLGTAAAATAFPSGVTAAASSSVPSSLADDYGTVVDVVEEGADNTGSTSVVDVLREHAADDTLLWFPPGRYLMDEQFRFSGFTNFGLVGPDATIVPAAMASVSGNIVSGEFTGPARLFKLGTYYAPGTGLRFEGFTFDYTAPGIGLRAIQAQVADDLLIKDVTVEGFHDGGTWGPISADITDPDGIGTLQNVNLPDGGAFSADTDGDIWVGPTGIVITPYHKGKLWVKDTTVVGFPDNGLYDSGADGRVVVDGGLYKNSNAANIRLSGDNCNVRNATVVVDANRGGDLNQRGIRLDSGDGLWLDNVDIRLERPNGNAITVMNGVGSAKIEDSSIYIGSDEARVSHGISVHPDAGPTDVQDVTIETHASGNAIKVDPAREAGGRFKAVNVTITGDAPGTSGRNAVRCYRDNCEFYYLTVDQPGPNYRRAIEIGGDNCLVYGGEYRSTHHPILNHGTGTDIMRLTAGSFDGYQAVKLGPDSADVTIVYSTLENGILDQGTDGLTAYGNTIP